MDSKEMMVRLMGACNTRPSYHGDRADGLICSARPGECRYNDKYYTPGMGDAKSWSMPKADETCSLRCPYLCKDRRMNND